MNSRSSSSSKVFSARQFQEVNVQSTAIDTDSRLQKPIDKVSSADVAVNIARITGMPESVAVINNADSANAQLAVASVDKAVVTKPQIVGAGLKSKKDIKDYTAVEGDTITSIAAKFGISADTVRLSNDIRGDAIEPGKKLTISPVNGLVYTVKAGDTPQSIASKYNANKDNLIVFNDAEVSGSFLAGERIVVPDGVAPSEPVATRGYREGPVASYASRFAFGSAPVYGSNGYDYGWCTWHAANRRKEIGRPVPSNLGNANTWLSLSRAAGLATGSTPQEGAVLWQKNIGGLGHVAFVEKDNGDGSFLVSDMNYPVWGRVTYRTITPGEFGNYMFIY